MILRNQKTVLSLLAVLFLLFVAVGGYGYGIWRQVQLAGSLTLFIQNKLSERVEGVFSSIEAAELEFRLSTMPVRLKAKNIRLNASDTIIVLPQSEFRFGLGNLLLGQLTPSEMSLSGLEIEIEQGSKGWHAGPSMAMLISLVNNNTNSRNTSTLTSIKALHINDAKLRIMRSPNVADTGRTDWIEIEPIAITLSKENNLFKGQINASDAVGGAVEIDFTGNDQGTNLDFSATLSDINADDIYPYLGIDIPEISSLGMVTGRLALTVRDRQLEGISGDLVSTDGSTVLPGYGDIDFATANLIFSHDAVLDTLTVTNFDMATRNFSDRPDGRIIFSGQVRHLTSPEATVIAKIKGSNFSFSRMLSLWPEQTEPVLREKVATSLNGGRVASFGLDAVGVINRNKKVFQLMTLDMISDIRQVKMETELASVERLSGLLSSRLEVSIGNNGIIEHAAADFLLQDAFLTPKESGKQIDLEGIELRTKLEGRTIHITRAAIDARELGQLALSAKIDINSDWRPHRLDIDVRAEQVATVMVSELWPEDLRPRARRWVSDRIDGGSINGFRVNGSFDLPENEPMRVISLDGEAQITDTELTYLSTMPPMKNTWATISFEGSSLRADIEKGEVEGVDFSGSRFILRPTEQGPEADLALIGTGAFGGAVKLIDHPRINILRPAGITAGLAEGQIDLTMGVKWILPPAGQTIASTGGMAINATASVQDMSFDGLPYETSIRNGVIDVIYLNRKLSISGRGNFNGAPGFISLDRHPDKSMDMDLALSKSASLTEWINEKTGLDLGGSTGGVVNIQGGGSMNAIQLETNLDLDDATINLSRLGVVKLQGEQAKLDARFFIRDGLIETIEDIHLNSDVLTARGQMNFDEGGRFLGAYFSELIWPGNNINSVTVERDSDDILSISAQASIVDLTPLRREESPGEGFAINVDLTSDRIILDQSVELSGNVLLATDRKGVGKAEFLGGLFLNQKPFMTEATLTAIFGGGNDLLEGRGLIGGAVASINLSPAEDGGNLMMLRSDNAGQVLKTLNIIDAIRGGRLSMVAQFKPDANDNFEIDFELESFRVIEAPTAVRMMSVLSLAGLYSLIEGDGTYFDLGHARIEVQPGKQIIHQARASGEALAVDLVGVINTETSEMEVSGALLPIYGITKLIGKVPVLREIITGVENEGVFVTQFSITGPIDDPENSVNLSSIVPGLFRDVFSPDWIRRERERLIGSASSEDNATAVQ